MKTPDERIAAVVRRLRMVRVTVSDGGGQSHFDGTCGALMLDRYAPSRASLALWLEDRATNILNGRETTEEAFAGSIFGRADAPGDEPIRESSKLSASIEQSIEVFRAALGRIEVPERDVKVTWDTVARWARLRMRLPSGAVVDKVLRGAAEVEVHLYGLALWLKGRARLFGTGAEGDDLDQVFAGYLVPKAVTR